LKKYCEENSESRPDDMDVEYRLNGFQDVVVVNDLISAAKKEARK